MNYYEIVYIIHPALQAGHLDDIISQVNKKITNLNGKILYQDNWGKKKLSYLIQKQKYGTYVLIQCMIDGNSINEISTEFELNTNILRHLVSKIDENDIFEQKVTEEIKEEPLTENIDTSKNETEESKEENVDSDDNNQEENQSNDSETKEEDNNNETGE